MLGGKILRPPSRDAAPRGTACLGRSGDDGTEVDARYSRSSQVTKAFLLDHMCAGSRCQQTTRAFPCGEWNDPRVTGSPCAFATRMELGRSSNKLV